MFNKIKFIILFFLYNNNEIKYDIYKFSYIKKKKITNNIGRRNEKKNYWFESRKSIRVNKT